MNKYAFYRGQAEAYVKLGFAPADVYGLLVSQGIDKTAAEEIVKEAILGKLLGWGVSAATKAAPKLTAAAGKAGQWGAQATGKGILGQGAQGWLGRTAEKGLSGLGKGMQEFAANPGQATKGFVKNFGSGMFGGQGGGVGGTLGRGLNYAGTGSMLYGMAGGGQ